MLKKGFTLAEVLITLAIIGVVAALTIPTLVHGIIDQRYRAFLKKDYSTLGQIVTRQVGQNGKYVTSVTSAASLTDFFKADLNVVKTSAAGNTVWLSDGSKMQFVYVAGCPAIVDALNFNPAVNCYVIVDVNGDKAPNYVSTDTSIADIYVLGIGPSYLLPVIPVSDITVDGTAGFADISGNPLKIDGAASSKVVAGNDSSVAAINE